MTQVCSVKRPDDSINARACNVLALPFSAECRKFKKLINETRYNASLAFNLGALSQEEFESIGDSCSAKEAKDMTFKLMQSSLSLYRKVVGGIEFNLAGRPLEKKVFKEFEQFLVKSRDDNFGKLLFSQVKELPVFQRSDFIDAFLKNNSSVSQFRIALSSQIYLETKAFFEERAKKEAQSKSQDII